MVDKILEPVDIFNGQFRTQRGRLPQKTSKHIIFVKLENFEKILCSCVNFLGQFAYRRTPKASRMLNAEQNGLKQTLTEGCG